MSAFINQIWSLTHNGCFCQTKMISNTWCLLLSKLYNLKHVINAFVNRNTHLVFSTKKRAFIPEQNFYKRLRLYTCSFFRTYIYWTFFFNHNPIGGYSDKFKLVNCAWSFLHSLYKLTKVYYKVNVFFWFNDAILNFGHIFDLLH